MTETEVSLETKQAWEADKSLMSPIKERAKLSPSFVV